MVAKTKQDLVEKIETDSTPEPVKPAQHKNTPQFGVSRVLIAGLVIIAIALFCGYALFQQIKTVNPQTLLEQGLAQLEESTSAEFTIRNLFGTDDFSFEINILAHKDENALSQVNGYFEITTEQNTTEIVDFSAIGGNNDVYIQGKYNNLATVEASIAEIDPQLLETQTYRLLLPVITQQAWLHIPDIDSMKEPDVAEDEEITPEEQAVFDKLREALILREFDRSYNRNEKSYRRITLGFDKEKVLESIELFKNVKSDTKISQINDLRDAVSKIETFDLDLIEILLDRNGDIRYISISTPEIPEQAVDDVVNSTTEESPIVSGLSSSFDRFTKYITETPEGSVTPVLEIEIDNINNVPTIEEPVNLIEAEDLLQAAQIEILPLLGPLFMQGAMMQQQQTPTMMNPNMQYRYPDGFEDPYQYQYDNTPPTFGY